MNSFLSWIPTLILAPLLFVQGRYVRRVTPKLPEPPGVRRGEDGGGRPLTILILGDSSAVGVGASNQSNALAGRLVSQLATNFSVSWRLMGESGLTTSELVALVADSPPDMFDVVIIAIGVNDVIAGRRTRDWITELSRLVALLRNDFAASHILFSPLPPMHCFTALPQPLRWCVGLRAHRFNHELFKFAQREARCRVVPLNYPLQPGYLASDGFHPGELAYAYWAGVLADEIRQLHLDMWQAASVKKADIRSI
jgi:lysophospholipase L1-like esterase